MCCVQFDADVSWKISPNQSIKNRIRLDFSLNNGILGTLTDGNQTISFYIIKNSYKQAILTEMVALKSPNIALNLCEIVNKIWNDRIRYEMAFLR